MHDSCGLDLNANRDNLERVREVVPALLRLFRSYEIRATWATVGAIGCTDWEEYFRRAPQPPDYKSVSLKVKPEYAALDPDGRLHFAPHLIEQIVGTPGQELGSHTFSHLYLREEGITAQDVAADLAAASALFRERFGVEPVSLVFPRNQAAFTETVSAAGIKIWRGNPGPWYYECEDSRHNGPLPRAMKLLDGINPLRRQAAPLQGDMTRATMFLRLGLPPLLWAAHRKRIENELNALRSGEIFHLWFHPHNVSPDMTLHLARVEQALELISQARERGTLTSRTMADLLA